ncbi:MAG TPA: ABC transporter permease [Ignavibacteriales bacterium]|nr:ABC transporter permease [Ignavibacteriales bacterium]
MFKIKKKKYDINQSNWGTKLTYFTFVMAFMYIPLVILIIYSFNDSKIVANWRGFTIKYYIELFNNDEILEAFYNTIIVGIFSTLISTVLGLLTALALENKKFTGQKILSAMIYIPLVMPDILMGVSMALFYNFLKVETGFITVLIAHITFCISYTTIVIQSRLEGFDYSLEEAAMDLGANRWQILYKIKLPIIMPGIIASALLAFTLSIDDFIITFFTTGRGFNTLPIYVEGAIRRGTMTTINALSTIMIGLTILITISASKFKKILLS